MTAIPVESSARPKMIFSEVMLSATAHWTISKTKFRMQILKAGGIKS